MFLGACIFPLLTLHLGDHELTNVYNFKYLGHWFTADGNKRLAVTVRMGEAKNRFGILRNIWEGEMFPEAAKIKLFEAAVVSVLLYGCEAWELDDKLMASLRGWSARCMTWITGRSIREECVDATYPLVMKVRQRRLRWLGHVLRASDSSLVRAAIIRLVEDSLAGKARLAGTILMDAPAFNSVSGLLELAMDRQLWNGLCNALCPKNS